jgi:hypothetical protein
VYGQELAQAMAELVLKEPSDGSEPVAEGSLPQATPTPLVAGTATARQGVDIIDAQLLRRLLERVNLASPSVLVDTRLERPALSLERKPTRKLLPRVAFGQD